VRSTAADFAPAADGQGAPGDEPNRISSGGYAATERANTLSVQAVEKPLYKKSKENRLAGFLPRSGRGTGCQGRRRRGDRKFLSRPPQGTKNFCRPYP